MGELRDQQVRFARTLPCLAIKAFGLGYEVTEGDSYRDPRVFGKYGMRKGYGSAVSAHKLRLAKDYNLFRDGQYLRETSDHLELGEWWESHGGIWGGRINDGNHYQWPRQPKDEKATCNIKLAQLYLETAGELVKQALTLMRSD